MPLRLLIWLTTIFSLISCWKDCTPKPVVRLLLRWCKSQQLCIRWMGRSSEYFKVINGVRQGGVLSPILFTIYLDSLLECLQASGRGCYWDNHFAGALCYADDLTILAPSPDALRKMIVDCEAFGHSHGLRFNAAKTQLICFRRTTCPVQCHFSFNEQSMPVVDSVVHLGNILQFNLSDRLDIHSKSMSFIRKANTVLFRFKCTDPLTKMKLFQSYCLSLYGSCLWRLDCEELNSLSASFNNIIRRIWNLPRISHTSIVHSVGSVVGIHNIVGLVVCVLLPCSTIHLLFVPFLLTVLVPVIRTLLVTTVCMALVIVNLIHRITLLLVI